MHIFLQSVMVALWLPYGKYIAQDWWKSAPRGSLDTRVQRTQDLNNFMYFVFSLVKLSFCFRLLNLAGCINVRIISISKWIHDLTWTYIKHSSDVLRTQFFLQSKRKLNCRYFHITRGRTQIFYCSVEGSHSKFVFQLK